MDEISGQRVYRKIGLPVAAFDVLKDLQRAWKLETNGHVLTRLLIEHGRDLLKNDEDTEDANKTRVTTSY